MKSLLCDTIREKLVDFADGELPAVEAAEVRAHLGECGACRSAVAALERSLGLAQAIWCDSESRLSPIDAPRRETRGSIKLRRSSWRRIGLVAASVGLFAVGVWYLKNRTAQSPSLPLSEVAQDGDDLGQIELRIAREGVASQMLAAANLLAEQPGGEDIACERYRYVLSAYGETQAATECESRLAAHCDGRNGS